MKKVLKYYLKKNKKYTSSYKAHNRTLIHHCKCNKINKSIQIIMDCLWCKSTCSGSNAQQFQEHASFTQGVYVYVIIIEF